MKDDLVMNAMMFLSQWQHEREKNENYLELVDLNKYYERIKLNEILQITLF